VDADAHRHLTAEAARNGGTPLTQIERYDEAAVFIGLDVGKSEHHAVALTRDGKKLYERGTGTDGRPTNPRLATLIAICQVLDIPLEEMLPAIPQLARLR
jgi:hypothetical protein